MLQALPSRRPCVALSPQLGSSLSREQNPSLQLPSLSAICENGVRAIRFSPRCSLFRRLVANLGVVSRGDLFSWSFHFVSDEDKSFCLGLYGGTIRGWSFTTSVRFRLVGTSPKPKAQV